MGIGGILANMRGKNEIFPLFYCIVFTCRTGALCRTPFPPPMLTPRVISSSESGVRNSAMSKGLRMNSMASEVTRESGT